MSTIIFQLQSTLILALLYLGLAYRKQRKKHVRFMLTGIIWDVILILQIELTRQAVIKALNPQKNSALLNFHISIAVLTVVLYALLVWMGRRMLKGDLSCKPLHQKLGLLAMALRTMTYVTSYLIHVL